MADKERKRVRLSDGEKRRLVDVLGESGDLTNRYKIAERRGPAYDDIMSAKGVANKSEGSRRAIDKYFEHLGQDGRQEYRNRWAKLRHLVESLLVAPAWTLDEFLTLVSGDPAEAIIVNLEWAFLGNVGFAPLPDCKPQPSPNSIEYVLLRIAFRHFAKDVAWKPSSRLALKLIAEAALRAGTPQKYEDFVTHVTQLVSSWGLHEVLPAMLTAYETPAGDDADARIMNRARRAHAAASCDLLAITDPEGHFAEYAQAVRDLECFCWREHYRNGHLRINPEVLFGRGGAPSEADLDRAVSVSSAIPPDDQKEHGSLGTDCAMDARGYEVALACADFVDLYPILNECLKASRGLIPWALLANPKAFVQHVLPLVARDHAHRLLNTKYAEDHLGSFYRFARDLLALLVDGDTGVAQIEALLDRMGVREELAAGRANGKPRNGRFLMIAGIALALQKHLAVENIDACRDWLTTHGELSRPMLGWAVGTAYLPAYLEFARVQARLAELEKSVSAPCRDNLLAWGDLLSYVVELTPADSRRRSQLQELFLPHLRQFGAALAATAHPAEGLCMMQRARSWELLSILDPAGRALLGDETDTREKRAARDFLFAGTGTLQGDEYRKPISSRAATDELIGKLSDFPDIARAYTARYIDAELLARVVHTCGLDKLRIIAFDVVPHSSSSCQDRAAAAQNGDLWANAWQAGKCTAVNLGRWFAVQRSELDKLHELLFDGRAWNEDATNDEVNEAGQSTARILGELSATLLKPVWETSATDGWAPPEAVMIVPTGRLFWIPWMAMPVPQCAGTKPLVEITPVGVVPSLGLAVWLMARAGLPACQDTIAFVGPNYFEDDSERDALRKTLNLNPSNWFPNARPGDLLDRKLEARCLAIACHGHAGREPYLQLFGEEADGRLSLQQLIERRPHLRAELALLGCCWTGQESTGVLDEVSGFAAALMQCGVRHVIAGLGMIPLAIATYPVVLDLVTRGTCAHFRQGILKLRKEYDSISLSHPACWSLIQWYGLPIQATGSAADTRT